MSKRKIDEAWRKPRIAKGTPFYKYSNIFTIGVIGISGLSWYMYQCWPESSKIQKGLREGKWEFSPEIKFHIDSMKVAQADPTYHELLIKMQKRAYEKEEAAKAKPWYVEILESKPEI
ncbi:hypothetical protein HHI36_022906 [Cryptolaemus montrouzieri]